MLATTSEETQESWSLLNTGKRIDGHARDQRKHQINAQADSSQAGSQQPEAPTQAFAFTRLLDSTSSPEGGQ